MQAHPTDIPGLLRLEPFTAPDTRGLFVKTFQSEQYRNLGLPLEFAEEYFTLSHAGTLRGLHFQVPPHDHAKIVFGVGGSVLDAVVDLRRGSPTYGRHALFELNLDQPTGLFIPAGLAHGFLVLEGPAVLFYKVTTSHAPNHDRGVRWDSAGIPWPCDAPLLSIRDAGFPTLEEFASPFVYRDAAGHGP
jgi:dTDP-4-dehydrorhamnose 3,5-epimerase